MTEREIPKPPSGLRAPGRAFWGEIVEQFIPSPGELEILRQAARCVDEVDRLERELRKQPFMVEGFAGQPRPNPLYKVVQEHRTLLRRLIDSLNIPDSPEQEIGLRPSQKHAQRSAQARWARKVS
jgi:hypothetical protein